MNAPKGVTRGSVRRACNDVVSIFANRHTAELPDFDLLACKSVAVLLEQDWARAGLPDADRDGEHGHGQEQQRDRADDDVLESLEPSACAREGGCKHADCRYPADFHPASMQWILLKRLRDGVRHALVDATLPGQSGAASVLKQVNGGGRVPERFDQGFDLFRTLGGRKRDEDAIDLSLSWRGSGCFRVICLSRRGFADRLLRSVDDDRASRRLGIPSSCSWRWFARCDGPTVRFRRSQDVSC